jgi:hypothetical protein
VVGKSPRPCWQPLAPSPYPDQLQHRRPAEAPASALGRRPRPTSPPPANRAGDPPSAPWQNERPGDSASS